MSQNDFNLANQGFPSMRADMNSAFQALASNSSGATEPSTMYAYQWWCDTTTDTLKIRNANNDAWITLAYLDQVTNEWEIRSAVIQAIDAAGVVIKTDDGTERMRIDSSGNLLVATTNNDPTGNNVAGIALRSLGVGLFSRDGGRAGEFNRKTSDGEIVAFRKDGSTVGSIGTSASYMYIGNGDTGLLFNGGGDTISPRNPSTGAGRDAAIDLGVSSERFKDLYLSGGLRGDTLTFSTLAGTERMRIDSSGNVGIGTDSPSADLDVASSNATIRLTDTDDTTYAEIRNNGGTFTIASDEGAAATNSSINFRVDATEAMRIDSSGNLLVGNTSFNSNNTGVLAGNNGTLYATRDTNPSAYFNRLSSDGDITVFRKDGTTVGSIGTYSGFTYYTGGSGSGVKMKNSSVVPTSGSGVDADGTESLGQAAVRWNDIYATNGTIQTSDINEKQQIASLTAAELTAAKTISGLFKTFKWNDSVAEKGDDARTHTGVIAQEVEQALTDAGLDAGDYAFFISSTWWEAQTEVPAVEAVAAQDAVYEDVIIPAVEEVLDEEGNVVTEAQPERTEQRLVSEAVEAVEGKEAYTRTDTYDTAEEAPEGATERNRKGIRYPELLSFIGAATEQRLASIEARLDALEGV